MFPVAIFTPLPSWLMVVSAPVPDTGLFSHPFISPDSKSVPEIVLIDVARSSPENSDNEEIMAMAMAAKGHFLLFVQVFNFSPLSINY